MTQDRHKPSEILETSDLVPTHLGSRSYSFVNPKRPRKKATLTRTSLHDPVLCTCPKMMAALTRKIIMVIWDGPVTLAPTSMHEDTLPKGDFTLECIEQAYDGEPWAFRYCPFGGCLIDAQVGILAQVDNMTCCGTMYEAVLHGRVKLPSPERFDRGSAKFPIPDRAAAIFSRCPWCATDMIDLVIARYKRHHGR